MDRAAEPETATKHPDDATDSLAGARALLRGFRVGTGYAMCAGSLALHLVIMLCFIRKWDIATAVTVFPIWLWAVAGGAMAVAGWLLARSRLPFIALGIWLVTVVFAADETRTLLRLSGHLQEAHPGEVDGKRILRVVTLNCSKRNADALAEVARLNPDIVLFQEAPPSVYAKQLAQTLYGTEGTAVSNFFCGVVARGQLKSVAGSGDPPYQQVVLTLADGIELDLFSIHLEHAVTRWDLWRPEAWLSYRNNRVERRRQLAFILDQYQKTAGVRPALIAGDFNAPPSDAIFDQLRPAFEDSFKTAGRGLGNTFHNRLPALRIDQMWVRNGLTPLNGRVFATKNSDHRMLVCDFLIDPPQR